MGVASYHVQGTLSSSRNPSSLGLIIFPLIFPEHYVQGYVYLQSHYGIHCGDSQINIRAVMIQLDHLLLVIYIEDLISCYREILSQIDNKIIMSVQ